MNLAERGGKNGESPHVEEFLYPSGPRAGSRSTTPRPTVLFQGAMISKPPEESGRATADAANAAFDRRLAEETRRAFETGREQGRSEGRQAEREAQAGSVVAAERERIRKVAELVEGFGRERDRYFAEVEREVVGLALAISARILRREAQMDPLLLTGAVRVALGQLSASTAAQLLVPAAELDLWTEAMAHAPNLTVVPSVVQGEGMRLGECVIKTDLGSVDLGIRTQLGEIERGFFDRVGRPVSDASTNKSGTREGGA